MLCKRVVIRNLKLTVFFTNIARFSVLSLLNMPEGDTLPYRVQCLKCKMVIGAKGPTRLVAKKNKYLKMTNSSMSMHANN